MKTFETEKHNIPEGATHYYYNAAGFGFYSLIRDAWRFWSPYGSCWKFVLDNKPAFEAFPIPQTNIETSEEKEVEWVNGDDCLYQGENWNFVSILSEDFHGTAVLFNTDTEELKQVPIVSLSKPETPIQKEERKRLETVRDMFSYWSEDEGDFVAGDANDRQVIDLLFALYNAGYKKKEDK